MDLAVQTLSFTHLEPQARSPSLNHGSLLHQVLSSEFDTAFIPAEVTVYKGAIMKTNHVEGDFTSTLFLVSRKKEI